MAKADSGTHSDTDRAENKTPVYLIVADGTEEFHSALRYAARAAVRHDARVAVLYVIEQQRGAGFMPWSGVQVRMDGALRREGEDFLNAIASEMKAYGVEPSLHLVEGSRVKAIKDLITGEPMISKLILGGDTGGRSPGPLVSYFCGKGMMDLRVPVTVVPGHLSAAAIDHFVASD